MCVKKGKRRGFYKDFIFESGAGKYRKKASVE